MSTPVTIGGQTYYIPATGENNWGQNVSDAIIAIVANISGSGFTNISTITTDTAAVSGKMYLVNTGAAVMVTLPAVALNAFVIVKDSTGTASTHNITIARTGAVAIDGTTADKVCSTNNGEWWFVCDGSNWFTIVNASLKAGLGQIVNADVNDSASIARTKIAVGTGDRIVVNAHTTGIMSDAAAITASRVLKSDANGIPVANDAITASRAVVSDASGFPVASATTAAELAYVNGVTSAIQGQIDSKAALAGNRTFSGFTALGTGNTQINIKTLTGTTSGAQGGSTSINHGLLGDKILCVMTIVRYSANTGMLPGNTEVGAGYEYGASYDITSVNVTNSAANSVNILGKAISVVVIYMA